ncbi:MAG TPA: anthranilate synthase component I [Blastocatellia bacterium]|nr:anthranilate synthase component I [Blastocatellia bacterium]
MEHIVDEHHHERISPASYDAFLANCREGTVVPVVKRVLADMLTPVSAFLRIAGDSPYAFLLESVEGGEKVARYSFLGAKPDSVLRVVSGEVFVEENGVTRRDDLPPLQAMRRYAGRYVPVRSDDLPPFTGGAVGFMGYGAIHWFEKLPDAHKDDLGIDDSIVAFFSTLVAFDHVRHEMVLISNVFTDGRTEGLEAEYDQALARIAAMEAQLELPASVPVPLGGERAKMRSTMNRDLFEMAVNRAKEYITAGDAFQVVLSQRLELSITAHPFQIYRALRVVNPSPYMFYLRLGDVTLVGASPEMLVRCTGRRVDYRPIAGTRPRGATDVEDALLGEELRTDEKETAEHVMLVDLGRNDLGRVCDFGSVEVTELMTIERYSHVMHIVSGIKGRLRAGSDRFDALAACFPAGTVTGAPKLRAMQIVDELEPTRRGPYSGAVFYVDYTGNLDSCITIRTLVIKGNKAYLQVGAGIVADSEPDKEYIETINKARAITRAIQMAEEGL